MQQLRNLSTSGLTSSCGTITVGCQKVSSEDVRRALTYKLTSWKEVSATAKAREQALKQQQLAFNNADFRIAERRGVVDAVAAHRHMFSFRTQVLDMSHRHLVRCSG